MTAQIIRNMNSAEVEGNGFKASKARVIVTVSPRYFLVYQLVDKVGTLTLTQPYEDMSRTKSGRALLFTSAEGDEWVVTPNRGGCCGNPLTRISVVQDVAELT